MESIFQRSASPTELASELSKRNSPEELSSFLRDASLEDLYRALEPLTYRQGNRASASISDARASARSRLDDLCKDVAAFAAVESNVHWIEALLAFALPLLVDALPKDRRGTSVVPHPHPLQKQVMPDSAQAITISGQMYFETNRACDNCDAHIQDREFWHCQDGCDVDFCKKCYEQLESLFANRDIQHSLWVVQFIWFVSQKILSTSPTEREIILRDLAFQWPIHMFQQLVKAVVDVADASVVHVEDRLMINCELVRHCSDYCVSEDIKNIAGGTGFWHTIGFLRILEAANRLPLAEHRLGEIYSEGARIPEASSFILQGIDKCSALSDWHRWHQTLDSQEEECSDVLLMHPFKINARFTCFLTHACLVPEAFRRQCAIFDVRSATTSLRAVKTYRLLKVKREPATELLAGVVAALGTEFFEGCEVRLEGLGAQPQLNGHLGTLKSFDASAVRWAVKLKSGEEKKVRPQNLARVRDEKTNIFHHIGHLFQVSFVGEPASGPGVNKEFIRLAFVCALRQLHPFQPWLYNEENRTHWFNNFDNDFKMQSHEAYDACAAYRATGALLGHAIANDCFLPSVFPVALYNLLLLAMGSSYVRPWSLVDLATVDSAIARSLEHLVEYEGDDIDELFVLNWPDTRKLRNMTKELRTGYVRDYVHWFFNVRCEEQQKAFCTGFCEVAGLSQMIRQHVGLEQLEHLLCGIEQAVNVSAVREGAIVLGWEPHEEAYLAAFWDPWTAFVN
eukprot:s3618_g6.t1